MSGPLGGASNLGPPGDLRLDNRLARAEGLAAGYGGRAVWSGATFEVAAGELVAVLGPNGSGKSTLLRLLLGQVPPIAGTVEVLGASPRRGHPAIGYVPQQRPMDPDLALRGTDLVHLGIDGHRWGVRLPGRHLRADRERVAAALDSVGATSYAGGRVGQLSGGERQRLLLAQALSGDPHLLLLDEPLTALDLRNQSLTAELVRRVTTERGLGTLLVAHDVNPLLRVIDKVLYVAAGHMAAGKPSEVITSEVLSHLYGAPVEVLSDARGRMFVVGLEDEAHHPHLP